MARTNDRVSARNRAREALAEKQRKRRERDERMEAAATKYFAAADAMERARRDAGEAIQALVDEGEARGEIADLLGISTREIKTALDSVPEDQDDDTKAEGPAANESESQADVGHESARGEDSAVA